MLVIKHVFIVVLAEVDGAFTDKKSAFVLDKGGRYCVSMTSIYYKM
jgi:hypothetical protein